MEEKDKEVSDVTSVIILVVFIVVVFGTVIGIITKNMEPNGSSQESSQRKTYSYEYEMSNEEKEVREYCKRNSGYCKRLYKSEMDRRKRLYGSYCQYAPYDVSTYRTEGYSDLWWEKCGK